MVSGRSLAAMPMSSDTSGIKFDSAEDTDYDDIEDNSAADVVLLSGRPMVKVKNLNINQHYCLKVSLLIIYIQLAPCIVVLNIHFMVPSIRATNIIS